VSKEVMIRLFQFVTRMRRFCFLSFLLALLSPAICGADASSPAATPIQQGFASMYNLDFAAAHQDFDAWQKLHPEDPMGPAWRPHAGSRAIEPKLHVTGLVNYMDPALSFNSLFLTRQANR
jgi:hypothetical protein